MLARTLLLGVALTAAGTAAKESFTMRVTPVTAFAPANILIRTRLEPDVQNRALEVSASSDDFYRSSTIPLDGDHAPRASDFEFRALPPGEYEVNATVIAADGKERAAAQTHVNIIDSGSLR